MEAIDVIKLFRKFYKTTTIVNSKRYIGYETQNSLLLDRYVITLQVAEILLNQLIEEIKRVSQIDNYELNSNQKISIISLISDIGISEFFKSKILILIKLNNLLIYNLLKKYIYVNKIKDPTKMKRRLVLYLIYTNKLTNLLLVKEYINGSN